MTDPQERQQTIVDTLVEALDDLMHANPVAFRTRFRKMAKDPYAFYRGSASVFYADMQALEDRWADERTSRVWIQGDLHAENFGTYMSNEGRLTFDVNDFDEAYVGHFSWDLRRFVASLSLLCWQKALPQETTRELSRIYLQAYLDRVQDYVADASADYAFQLDNSEGTVLEVLHAARAGRRPRFLESMTVIDEYERHFREDGSVRQLEDEEYRRVEAAFQDYLGTVPEHDRAGRRVFYETKAIVGKKGFGIGSAGLPAYNILIEGYDEAQENDIILTMKQASVAAPSRIVTDERVREFFTDDGHRAVVSQRSLQTHTDPFLGHTVLDGKAFVVSELSPYKLDLEWENLTEPDQIAPVLRDLGRATAKIHCSSDEDSDQHLVPFRTETAIQDVVGGREEEFIEDIVDFAEQYAGVVRRDHALFVGAFREGGISAVPAV